LHRRHPRRRVLTANEAERFWFGFGGKSPASHADLSGMPRTATFAPSKIQNAFHPRKGKPVARRGRKAMGLEPTGPTPFTDVNDAERLEVARLPKGWTSGEEPVRPRATTPKIVCRLSFGSSRRVSSRDASCRDLSSPFSESSQAGDVPARRDRVPGSKRTAASTMSVIRFPVTPPSAMLHPNPPRRIRS
jgi:hypothetical protein